MITSFINCKRIIKVLLISLLAIILICTFNVINSFVYANNIDVINKNISDGSNRLDVDYFLDDNRINFTCSSCSKSGSVTFVMSDFDSAFNKAYYAGADLSFKIKVEKSSWKDVHISSYPTLVYGYLDIETGMVSEYSLKAPTKPGAYTVKLAILSIDSDVSSEIIATEEKAFNLISKSSCKHNDVFYYCEDNKIIARCKNCYNILSSAENRYQ